MKSFFNEDPDCVNKNLALCSLHFTADSFKNKTQFDAGFSERLKPKNFTVPTILIRQSCRNTSVSNSFHYMVTIALCLLTDRLICFELSLSF